IDRSGPAQQIVVALLPSDVYAVLHGVSADNVAERVAEVVGVFGEDAGSCLAARSSETNPVEPVTFNFDARYAEIDILLRFELVEANPREVEPHFVQHGGLQRSNPGKGDGRICTLGIDVANGPALPACIAVQPAEMRDVGADCKLIVAVRAEVEAEIILVTRDPSRQRELGKQDIRYSVEASPDRLRDVLAYRAGGRSEIQTAVYNLARSASQRGAVFR